MKLLRLLKIGCLLFLVAAGVALWTLYAVLVPADPDGQRESEIVEVSEGATGADVAQLLEDRGLIRSAFGFRMMLRYRGQSDALKSGFYEVDPKEPAIKIFETLVKGDQRTREATFPEGLTIPEVAAIVETAQVASAEEFLGLASTQGKLFGPNYPPSLEGYLFPDTYKFGWASSAEETVGAMVAQFEQVAGPLWAEHKEKTPLSLHDTVILASLIEREAQVDSERAIIASVYLNRLKKEMLLQCDATVQYALGRPKAVLMYEDLKVDSPYNTYKHAGLPPGPICSPGGAALKAAMNPASSDYLFYVRNDLKGDGSHVFTRTYAEHQQAIRKYQR